MVFMVFFEGFYNVEEFTVFKIFKKLIHDTTFVDQVDNHERLVGNTNFEPKNYYGRNLITLIYLMAIL